MTNEFFVVTTDDELRSCFPAFSVLRPHLVEEDFLLQVKRQQQQSFQIVALRHDSVIRSAAGYRITEFLAWGKILYIDDLTTLPNDRSKGFASALMDWLIVCARSEECSAVHLDTGYMRHAAHRLYLQKGFRLRCHHMSLNLFDD